MSLFACAGLILSARSVSSRAALRPVRAGFRISPPGIRAGLREIGRFVFCRLTMLRSRFLQHHISFFACEKLILTARSVSSRAALRPERAVLNQPEFQGWLVGGWKFCVLSIDSVAQSRKKLPDGSFFRPRMISLVLVAQRLTFDFCRGSYPLPNRVSGLVCVGMGIFF